MNDMQSGGDFLCPRAVEKNHFPKDSILSWSKAVFFSLLIEELQAAFILTAPSGWSKYRQQKTFNETQSM